MPVFPTKKTERLDFMGILIIVLSIYILTALLIDAFFTLPKEVSRLLHIIDTFICIIFLFDFVRRFYNAPDKLKYMKWGWIDLISSIPAFDFMRVGRTFTLIRLLRIIRAFRTTTHLAKHVFRRRTQGAITAAVLVAILMVIFSSIAILQIETAPNSNIKTAEDALWWSYITITTVGYGDRYPVTTGGRAIAAFLITIGVGLFGTFTAYIASWFIEQTKQEDELVKDDEY